MTVLGFAINSQLPATAAKKYLDLKAKEFNGNFDVSEEGNISYYFHI